MTRFGSSQNKAASEWIMLIAGKTSYNVGEHYAIMDLLSRDVAGKKITKGSRYVLVVFMEIEDFEIHHSWEMPCSSSIDCCTIC